MYRSFAFKVLRLMALLAPLIAIPAFAQFEVAPDHFDSNESQHKPAGKQAKIAKTAKIAMPARAKYQRNDASGPALTSQGLYAAKTPRRNLSRRQTASGRTKRPDKVKTVAMRL